MFLTEGKNRIFRHGMPFSGSPTVDPSWCLMGENSTIVSGGTAAAYVPVSLQRWDANHGDYPNKIGSHAVLYPFQPIEVTDVISTRGEQQTLNGHYWVTDGGTGEDEDGTITPYIWFLDHLFNTDYSAAPVRATFDFSDDFIISNNITSSTSYTLNIAPLYVSVLGGGLYRGTQFSTASAAVTGGKSVTSLDVVLHSSRYNNGEAGIHGLYLCGFMLHYNNDGIKVVNPSTNPVYYYRPYRGNSRLYVSGMAVCRSSLRNQQRDGTILQPFMGSANGMNSIKAVDVTVLKDQANSPAKSDVTEEVKT